MGTAKQQMMEDEQRRERLCDRCERRPKTHRCRCCDEVTLCAWCAADLFDGPICPGCENRRDDGNEHHQDQRPITKETSHVRE